MGRGRMGHKTSDPTPSQILALCAKVREGWDEEEIRKRVTGERHEEHWTPPVCGVEDQWLLDHGFGSQISGSDG